MSGTDAAPAVGAHIPLIDVGALLDPHASDEALAALADRLRCACMENGFFYITGHGIEPSLIEDAFAAARVFFSLPEEEKLAISTAHSACNRGYEPLRGQVLEAGAPPDVKEGFYLGVDLPADDPRVLAGKFNHGPNQWPAAPASFRPTMERYYRALSDLGAHLMEGVALSLGLPRDWFTDFSRDPMCTLRLLHYPPQPANPAPNEKGCGAHTDFGGLTILMQDQTGGLEVCDRHAGWIAATPIPGSYVVNLGDMIQRWTNGMYRSTLHRVVNRSGTERYSIPFFFTGNPDHIVDCIPACLAPGETPAFPPITVSDHIEERYRQTYL